MTVLSTLRDSEKTDFSATLLEAKDWPEWDHDFMLKVDTLGLTQIIKFKRLAIPQPEIPNIAQKKYEKKAGRAEPVESRSDTIEVATQLEEADDEETIQYKRNGGTWMMSDLTVTGKQLLDTDNTYYDRIQKVYREEAQSLSLLTNHILRTVAPHYKTTCCIPGKPIWVWYENLKLQCGKAQSDEREEARQAYKAALQPLRQSKNASKWINNWEIAFATAEQRGVAETTIVSSWANDFLDAIAEAFPIWSSTYALTKSDQIRNGTLTHRELSNDFRKAILRANASRIGKVSRGAFGATYNGEDTGEYDDSTAGPKKEKNKKGVGKRRLGGNTNRDKDCPECPACGLIHTLANCFYVFPGKAWTGFRPREQLAERVAQALENPDLQAQVRALKRGKSKTRTPQPKDEPEPEEIHD